MILFLSLISGGSLAPFYLSDYLGCNQFLLGLASPFCTLLRIHNVDVVVVVPDVNVAVVVPDVDSHLPGVAPMGFFFLGSLQPLSQLVSRVLPGFPHWGLLQSQGIWLQSFGRTN